MTHDQERDAFEAWYRQEYSFSGKFGVFASGDYVSEHTHKKWHVWQEAWQAAKREPDEAMAKLDACPDGCWRPKARNADDCAAGCCSKWYAVRDPAAQDECAKLAVFWKGGANQPTPVQEAMAKDAELRKAVFEHIADLRRCADTARQHNLGKLAAEFESAAIELEAHLTTPRGG